MALSGIGRVDVTNAAFVGVNASLKAGHAAHPRCWADEERRREASVLWLIAVEFVLLMSAVCFGVLWLLGGSYEPHAGLAVILLGATEWARRTRLSRPLADSFGTDPGVSPSSPSTTPPAFEAPSVEASDQTLAPAGAADSRQYPPELRVEGLPLTHVDARASSPLDIITFVRQAPPLDRRSVGEAAYRGKWISWSGAIRHIEDRNYCISILAETPDGGHVTLSFAPWERPEIAAFREGDAVTFEGQITRADAGVVELVRVKVSRARPINGLKRTRRR